MIGNNSCGATAQRTGKVVDNVDRLEVLLVDGTRLWVGPTSDDEYADIVTAGGRPAELYRQLRALTERYADVIRTRFPRIPRRVSGYNLDSLLPEHGFNVAGALVGSESTLVTVLRAELKLVPVVKARTMVILGYPDVAAAGDAVVDVLPSQPVILEGIDRKLVDFERRKGMNRPALELLPSGGAWLIVELGGDTNDEADGRADELLGRLGRRRDGQDVRFFDDPAHEEELWEVREAALGATARVPGMSDTWPGWEDSAVDPADLGEYLRDLNRLYEEFGFTQASLYGHFGQGCVHTRIPFDLFTADGVRQFRSFLERAADLVASYGGSLSGEHGDGQARGELLARMFGPEILEAFGRMKALFDPDNLMNPGKVVAPNPFDHQLRLGTDYEHVHQETVFRYPDDEGDFGRAVLRCVGVGKCRREREVSCAPRTWSPKTNSTRRAVEPGCCSRCSTARHAAARSPTAGDRRRSVMLSTCAWPARDVNPTARCTSTWQPTKQSFSTTTTDIACAPPLITPWAGCRSPRRLRPSHPQSSTS